MDVSETMKQTEGKQQIATADPVTLVALARQGFYEIPANQRTTPWALALEEVIGRFESSSRAHLGASTLQTSRPS